MKHINPYRIFEARNTGDLTPKQIRWLNECSQGARSWSVNPQTGLVDVTGNFNCYLKRTGFNGVRFGTIYGKDSIFDCTFSGLKSLEGAPLKVEGSFSCSNNNLVSLKGAPQEVGGDFFCRNNELESLEGAPQIVGEEFSCWGNRLKTLEGAPQEVGGSFVCSSNGLRSLRGAPLVVGGGFECWNNHLETLEGAPREVGRWFICSANPFKSFAGAPSKIGGLFCYDLFEIRAWKPESWLRQFKKGGKHAELFLPLLPERYLDTWIKKNPMDMDLLDPYPVIKAGVLQRTGLDDISDLARAMRRGII